MANETSGFQRKEKKKQRKEKAKEKKKKCIISRSVDCIMIIVYSQ
jgi:hypothetical protein